MLVVVFFLNHRLVTCDPFIFIRYEKAIVAMAKQRVTLEVLSYHATAPAEDATKLKVNIS